MYHPYFSANHDDNVSIPHRRIRRRIYEDETKGVR